jgi:hypothetical protein
MSTPIMIRSNLDGEFHVGNVMARICKAGPNSKGIYAYLLPSQTLGACNATCAARASTSACVIELTG